MGRHLGGELSEVVESRKERCESLGIDLVVLVDEQIAQPDHRGGVQCYVGTQDAVSLQEDDALAIRLRRAEVPERHELAGDVDNDLNGLEQTVSERPFVPAIAKAALNGTLRVSVNFRPTCSNDQT